MEQLCDYKCSKNLACLFKINKDVIQSCSLIREFWVFILTPIDEDDVPLNGGIHGLTQTKCTSFAST
jgi:hypothetical protein